MALPDGFLDELKTRIRPSDLIGRTVALKRQGREFVGLSPFKKERTPSFFVNDEKGFYHCFASQEHGDVITWLQKTQGLSFIEAVEALASEVGLDVPKDAPPDPKAEARKRSALEWIEAAQSYFVRQLQSPQGEDARMYLERRGLKAKDIETFGLGFAPDTRRGLVQALTQKGASIEDLDEAGLIIIPDDGGQPYDRFRGRVMFPIEDTRGRLVAFGGRAMSKDARAKYLNSPETSLFHKGSQLYRYPQARRFANDPKVKAKGLIVAEGYMDVIAFARAGMEQAVAPLGTALTEDQIRLLWRAGSEPVLCLDGDEAGTRAASRAAENALPLLEPGRTLRFVFLPEGKDPDDMLSEKGPQALSEAIEDARPLIDVLWEREKAAEPLDDPDRRAGFRKRLRQLVAKIADGDVKAEYRAEFDRRLDGLFQTARGSPRGVRRGLLPRQSRFGPPPGPSNELKQARKGSAAYGSVPDQLLLACIEYPDIANLETEALAEMAFGPLDSLRDAILDACSDEADSSGAGLYDVLRQRGFGPQLLRMRSFRPAMRASLGGEDADAQSRQEAWRRLSNSYMERVAHDARTAEERARQADVFEQGDPQALQTFLAAVRRDRKR